MAADRVIRNQVYSFTLQASHELTSSECLDICGAEFKPLAVSSLRLESLMPVRLYADRVISANGVHGIGFLRKLDRKLALTAPKGIAPPDLVKVPRLQKINKPDFLSASFLFIDLNLVQFRHCLAHC